MRRYTKEILGDAIAANQSMAGVMRFLGLRPAGGTHYYLLLKAREWGIDMSHFTGQGHLRGKTHSWTRKKPLSELLVEGSKSHRTSIKRRLIKEGVLENKCYSCGQMAEWNGKCLVMVLDHKNGIRDDYRKENLRLLCPNCNSQTDTFCSRNRKKFSDEIVIDVVRKEGVRGCARTLGMSEGGVGQRMRTIRGCAGVGKRA